MFRVNLKKIFFFIVVLLYGVIFSTLSIASKTTDSGVSQEWAVVNGFRSAKFGFSERSVYKAIKKDFKISKKNNFFYNRFTLWRYFFYFIYCLKNY